MVKNPPKPDTVMQTLLPYKEADKQANGTGAGKL